MTERKPYVIGEPESLVGGRGRTVIYAIYLVLPFLFLFAAAILIIGAVGSEITPSMPRTWPLRLSSLIVVFGALALH